MYHFATIATVSENVSFLNVPFRAMLHSQRDCPFFERRHFDNVVNVIRPARLDFSDFTLDKDPSVWYNMSYLNL